MQVQHPVDRARVLKPLRHVNDLIAYTCQLLAYKISENHDKKSNQQGMPMSSHACQGPLTLHDKTRWATEDNCVDNRVA